jgi:hypothetical protein
MPNVFSSWCPLSDTLVVFLPIRMSMTCPAPYRWPRSRSSRTMVESSFCAATVPSHVSGGDRQVSQFPQATARSPK